MDLIAEMQEVSAMLIGYSLQKQEIAPQSALCKRDLRLLVHSATRCLGQPCKTWTLGPQKSHHKPASAYALRPPSSNKMPASEYALRHQSSHQKPASECALVSVT